jgi:hypothetical protein
MIVFSLYNVNLFTLSLIKGKGEHQNLSISLEQKDQTKPIKTKFLHEEFIKVTKIEEQ